MILTRIRYIFILVLFLLAVSYSEKERVVFDVLHKPLEPFAGVQYEALPVEASYSFLPKSSLSEPVHTIDANFSTGRQLVGKVNLLLSSDVQLTNETRATVILLDEGKEVVAAATLITKTGEVELVFDGHFAESARIEITGVEKNPITDFTISSIVLSSNTRIMLLGDSITEAHYDSTGTITEGYRHRLYNRLSQSYNIDFVGTSGDAPYEAHCDGGKRISAFYQGGSMDVRGPMNTHHPHIVGIHLGTNDINNDENPVETAEHMRKLVNYLLEWRYDSSGRILDEAIRLEHIVVSLIIPAKYDDELSIETNRYIALVVDDFISGRETGRPEPVYAVDFFSRFREWPPSDANSWYSLMWDRLHPDNSGHELMASTYFEKFDEILSGQPDRRWFSDVSFLANIIGTDYQYNDNNTTDFFNHAFAVADINNDGIDDLYSTRSDYGNNTAHDNFYMGNASLPYSDRTDDFDLEDPGGSRGAVFVDIDNDGDFDLFNGNSPGPNKIYENLNGVDFRLASAGMSNINATTTGVAVFDAENDGDMDVLAVNSKGVNEFYLNNGTGYFSSTESALGDIGGSNYSSYAVAPADFDLDGDTDIYITYKDATNKLFINNGNGTFTDRTSAAGLTFVGRSNGASWSDLDLDGDLDLVVTQSRADDNDTRTLLLYENESDGTFTNVSSQFNIPVDGFTTILADLNNDGFDDLITTFEKEKAVLWENHGNWHFEKVSNTGAEINGGDIRGGAVFDYDNDGDVDIAFARSDMLNVLLQNNYAEGYNYLHVYALGPAGNAGGFGTKVWLYESGHTNDNNYLLGFREIVSASGHMSQSSPTLHFGLGLHTTVDLVAHFIDGSSLIQKNIAANQTILIEPTGEIIIGDPAQIEYVSGDNQTGTVGTQLSQPLKVRVTDENGHGVPNVFVDFSVAQGDADLFILGENVTDSLGLAQRFLQLGHQAGEIIVEATLEFDGQLLPDSPIRIHARSLAGQAVRLHKTSGDGQSGKPGVELNAPLVVTLFDAFDNPTPDVQVTFSSLSGLLTPLSPISSDGNGRAAVRFTPDESSSRQQVQAEAAGLTPVTFTTYVSGIAEKMLVLSTKTVSGRVMSPVADPIRVKILADSTTNEPAANYAVTFSTFTAGGRLSTSTNFSNTDSILVVHTDGQGLSQVYWRLGEKSGTQNLKIEAGDISNSPEWITATASAASPALLLLVDGNEQNGPIGEPLKKPFRVRVTDSYGNPIENISVKFTSTSNGSFDGSALLTMNTNSAGEATAVYTLGTNAGYQKVATAEARQNGQLIGSRIDFYATATGGAAKNSAIHSGNDQTGIVDTEAPEPLTIRITDKFGNPVPGFPVTFSSLADGLVNGQESATIQTNTSGLASITYTLGKIAGDQHIEALCPGLTPARQEFVIHALAAYPTKISEVSGNFQTGATNTTLPDSLVVRVTDRYGNTVPEHPVIFTVTSKPGTLSGTKSQTVQTDKFGLSRVLLTLGDELGESNHIVEASSANNNSPLKNSPITFYASARVGTPHKLVAVSNMTNLVGAAEQVLPEPIVVKIVDNDQQPIAGFVVKFHVIAGFGHIQESGQTTYEVTTNGDGQASIHWVLGQLGVTQKLWILAAHNGDQLINSPMTVEATAVAATPHELKIVSGNNQSGSRHTTLSDPLVVRVLDTYGEPVANHTVLFLVSQGDGFFVQTGSTTVTTKTDQNGQANVQFALGDDVGQQAYIIVARAFNNSGTELQHSPATFYVHGITRELRIISGDGQSQPVTTSLPKALRVRLVDENQHGIENQTVEFNVLSGDLKFSGSATQHTNADGYTQISAQFGTQAGRINVEASAPAFESRVTFTLTALPGAPSLLKKISGDEQVGVTHHKLNQKINVQLMDEYGNGISGQVVQFEMPQGHGFVSPSDHSQTDSSGQVLMDWFLGSVTPQQYLFVKNSHLNKTLTFTANAFANQAPTISVADSFSTSENAELTFRLRVSDAENDSIHLSSPNVPAGADFDSQTHQFTWTPNFTQAGRHWIIFKATDEFGAATIKTVHIRVKNANRAPIIAEELCRPQNRELGAIRIPDMIDFHVQASDPDGDLLFYLWRVNGVNEGSSEEYQLNTQLWGAADVQVEALVFDRQDTSRTSWTLKLVTSVELNAFAASFDAYTGVRLEWDTRHEWDNSGFYVLRSEARNGRFLPIGHFIESNPLGQYRFIDDDVESGLTYFYRLQDVQRNGATNESDIITFSPPVPESFSLHQNYPNPFNPSTTIRFDVARRSFVSLTVYDILGRQVRRLIHNELKPGFHNIEWDGVNDYGELVASGVYHAVLDTEAGRFVKKMAVVR